MVSRFHLGWGRGEYWEYGFSHCFGFCSPGSYGANEGDSRDVKNLDSGTKPLGAGILVLRLSSCMTLDRLFDLLCLSFLIFKGVIIMETIS